ncbi:MAG: hypothetical protein HY298_20900 [Verrucomicrobia bacterium]|nr:hypothetical protein [Verrucomicrobiota bacterium]
MGADLYIEKIRKPILEKYEPLFEEAVRRRDRLPRDSKEATVAQEEVVKYYDLMLTEGYFRDSYNVTCLLNWLRLSWWQDVIPLCTKERKLRADQLRKFRELVARAKLEPITKEKIEARGGTVDDRENSLDEWHLYFMEKHAELVVFLDQAIKLNTHVTCSL